MGAALHRPGRPGRHAARTQPAVGTRRRHRAGAGQRHRDDDLQPAQPQHAADQPLWHGRLVSLSEPGLSSAGGGRLGQDGRFVAVGRHPHLRPSGRARVQLRELDGGGARRQHLCHRRPAGRIERRRPCPRQQVRPRRPAGGTVEVAWRVDSVSLPIDQVEIVVGGLAWPTSSGPDVLGKSGTAPVQRHRESTWVAAARARQLSRTSRTRSPRTTSAVQVSVGDQPLFCDRRQRRVGADRRGAGLRGYARAPARSATFQAMRASLEAAYNRLHQRIHRAGVFHQHTPLQEHQTPHEQSSAAFCFSERWYSSIFHRFW